MNNKKKFFLHGGSSLISKFLIEKFKDDFDEMYIFSRDTKKTKENIDFNNYKEKKFFFLKMTLKILK